MAEKIEQLERLLAEDEANDDLPEAHEVEAYVARLAKDLGLALSVADLPAETPAPQPARVARSADGPWSSA